MLYLLLLLADPQQVLCLGLDRFPESVFLSRAHAFTVVHSFAHVFWGRFSYFLFQSLKVHRLRLLHLVAYLHRSFFLKRSFLGILEADHRTRVYIGSPPSLFDLLNVIKFSVVLHLEMLHLSVEFLLVLAVLVQSVHYRALVGPVQLELPPYGAFLPLQIRNLVAQSVELLLSGLL